MTLGLGLMLPAAGRGLPGAPLADKFVFAGTGFRALTRATTSPPAARTTAKRYGISQKVGAMPAWVSTEVVMWFPTVVCHTSSPVTGSNETDMHAGTVLEAVTVSFDEGTTWYDVTFGGLTAKTIDASTDPGGFIGVVDLGSDTVAANAPVWVRTAWDMAWVDGSTQGFFGQSGAQRTNNNEFSRDASTSFLSAIGDSGVGSTGSNSSEFYAPTAVFAKGNDGRAVFCGFGDSRLYFQDHQDKAIWPVAKGDWPANPRGAQGDIELAFDREETWKRRIPIGMCAVPGQNGEDWGASDTDWRTFKLMIDAVTALNGGTLPFTHMLNEHMVNRPSGMNNYAGTGNFQESLSAWIAKLKSYYPGVPLWGVLNMPHANDNDDGYTTGANNAPSSDYSTWSATPSDTNCLAAWIIDHLPGGALEDEYDVVVKCWESGIALDTDTHRDRWKPRSCDCTLAADTAPGDLISLNADRAPVVGEAIVLDPRGNREEFAVLAVTGSGPYTVRLDDFPANLYTSGDRVVLGYYGQLTSDYANTGPTLYVDRDPGVGTRIVVNPLQLDSNGRGATVIADVSGSGPYTLTAIGKANAVNITGADVLEGPSDGYHVAGRSCYESANEFWSPILVAEGVAAVPGVPHLSFAGLPGLESGSDPWLILTASDAQVAAGRAVIDAVSTQPDAGIDGFSAKLKDWATPVACRIGQALPNNWGSNLANPTRPMVVAHSTAFGSENAEKILISDGDGFAMSEATRAALVAGGADLDDAFIGHLYAQWGGGNLTTSFAASLDAATTQGDLETIFSARAAAIVASFDGSAADMPVPVVFDVANEVPDSDGSIRTANKYYDAAARVWSLGDGWAEQMNLLEVELAQGVAAGLYGGTCQASLRDFYMLDAVDEAQKLRDWATGTVVNNRAPVSNDAITAGNNSVWSKFMANMDLAAEMALRGKPLDVFFDQAHFRGDQPVSVLEAERRFATAAWYGLEWGIGELNVIDASKAAMTDYFKNHLFAAGDHSERHRAYAYAHVAQVFDLAFARTLMRNVFFWTDSDSSGGHTCMPLMGQDQVDGNEKLSWLYPAALNALKRAKHPDDRTGVQRYCYQDMRGASLSPGWQLMGSVAPDTTKDGTNVTTFAGALRRLIALWGCYGGTAGNWAPSGGNGLFITGEAIAAAPDQTNDLNGASSWCIMDITDDSAILTPSIVGPNNRVQVRQATSGVLQLNALTTAGTATINTTDIGTPSSTENWCLGLRFDAGGIVACLDDATPVSLPYTMGAPSGLSVVDFLGSAVQTSQWANGPRLRAAIPMKAADIGTDAKLRAWTAKHRATSYAAGVPVAEIGNVWEVPA